MHRPRFSIVVPTRNRTETLPATLRTCLAQTFEDFEVIVSDNCSEPSAGELVEALQSPKIRYVRTKAPLPMSANWEFGVSQATGEFITVLGDDDALLFHALKEADDAIRSLHVDLLTARGVFYTWPGTNSPAFSENTLVIPTLNATRLRSAPALLQDVLNQFSNMLRLPSIYNSFVRRDALELIRGKNRQIFNSSIPDWYTAFALASSIHRYGESGVPLRIDGMNNKSNGDRFIRGAANRFQAEFDRLNTTDGIPWNSHVPRVSVSAAALAAECLQQLRENARHHDSRLDINPRDLMRAIIRDIQNCPHPISPDSWRQQLDEVERYASRVSETEWYRVTFGYLNKDIPLTWKPPKRPANGLYPDRLVMDAAQFHVTDVYGAADLFEKIFLRRVTQPEMLVDTSPTSRWIAATKDLVREFSTPGMVRVGRGFRKSLADAKQRFISS